MKYIFCKKIAGQSVIVENRVILIVKQIKSGESMKVSRNGRSCIKLLHIITAFFLLPMASGCGNDPAASSTAYDPFSVYEGKETPADITSHNVSQIVFDLYS